MTHEDLQSLTCSFILLVGLGLLVSVLEFYTIIIRNWEIINSSMQHYYMKVHLHVDSVDLPNRVGKWPENHNVM